MKFLPNGQWTLAKSNSFAPKSNLSDLVGKTHTVEVHPHIDHLLQLKGFMQEMAHVPNMPPVTINQIKKSHFGYLANKIPRDSRGVVTPEMIDKHIASLPKHKVEIKIVPYHSAQQQHRPDVPQYVASVGFHPDTLNAMSPKERQSWNLIRNYQHQLGGHENQIGWARIDPHRKNNGNVMHNGGHWHIDEIQSDFGTPKALKDVTDTVFDPREIEWEARKNMRELFRRRDGSLDYNDADNYQENARAFKKLYPGLAPIVDEYSDHSRDSENEWNRIANERNKLAEQIQTGPDITLEENRKKLKELDDLLDNHSQVWDQKIPHINDHLMRYADLHSRWRQAQDFGAHHLKDKLAHGHDDPMHMIHSAINQLGRQHGTESISMDMPWDQAHQSELRPSNALPHKQYPEDKTMWEPSNDPPTYDDLPVHQVNTYDKRPAKLGFNPISKEQVLGDDPNDPYSHVQFNLLYKKLREIQELLRKI